MTVNIIRLPATPDRRPVNPDCIPAELQARPQWVGWDVTTIVTGKGRNRTERQTKTPIDVKRGSARADVTDPADHNPFDAVLANSQRFKFYGIGFVFTAKDPYIGIDLDKCRNPDTGVIEPWALAIVEAFGTYTEPSPSETGLHLIARGIIPGDRNRAGKIEMYDRARFFTMTGDPLDGYEQITDCQDALDTFYAETFPAPAPASPRPAITLTMDDHDLIAKVRAARNGAKFDRLYSGDSGDCGGDASAGDLAFVSMLTFYNPDEAQIDRIVRQSGRYRPKWEREDYRRRTIEKASERATFYDPTPRAASNGSRDMTPMAATTPARHTPEDAHGCVVELARIAELEQTLAERDAVIAEQAAKIERLQARIRMHNDEKMVRQNPKLKAERDLVIEVAHSVATLQEQERRRARKEGREPSREVKLPPYKVLAERIGCSESKVSRDFKKIRTWGVIEARQETTHKPERMIPSGDILPAGYVTETYVTLPADPDVWLMSMTDFQPDRFDPEIGRERTHGGNRTRCKQHPHADVTITETCSVCGDILKRSTRRSQQATDTLQSEKPMQTGDCNLQSTSTLPSVEVGRGQQDAISTLECRVAMRDVRPHLHHASSGAEPFHDLDERIVAAVVASPNPMDESSIAIAVGRQRRDVRSSITYLIQRGRLKRWGDDLVTVPIQSAPIAAGGD